MRFLAIIISLVVLSAEAKTVRVNSYKKKNGTYVQPYFRTSANKTKLDNWSTKGNANPINGNKGYVDPYK